MLPTKLIVAVVIVAALTAFFALDLHTFLSLDFFQAQRTAIDAYVSAAPVQAGVVFLLGYIVVTGLSLPGAAVLTLVAGALFGLLWGTLIVSFASSIGATLAFLSSRYLLRDGVRTRFGDKLKAVDDGIKKDGAFYLFALRLVPAFPFFLINLAMGLTPIRTRTFYWVSQLGMLAGTLVYVYA
ncbi:MAG TPA: TVP38/TMEM64 family protein, partial [Burkholderiales bacterium]|nr:TVP38/TMEM64 family protein [Burkholderiales bacterium]